MSKQTTAERKAKLPHVHTRKDARTRIYTLMYGPGMKQHPDKKLNEQRKAPAFDSLRNLHGKSPDYYVSIKQTIIALWPIAQFDAVTQAKIMEDFNSRCTGAAYLTAKDFE